MRDMRYDDVFVIPCMWRARQRANVIGMILTPNVHLIHRFYRDMWNRFDKSVFGEILAEDIKFRGSLGQDAVGYEEFAAYMDVIRRAFPDFTNTIEEIVSEGDRSVARLTYCGTHQGEVLGIAPTGRTIEYAGVAFFRFREGRIAEVWVLGDVYGLLKQLKDEGG